MIVSQREDTADEIVESSLNILNGVVSLLLNDQFVVFAYIRLATKLLVEYKSQKITSDMLKAICDIVLQVDLKNTEKGQDMVLRLLLVV